MRTITPPTPLPDWRGVQHARVTSAERDAIRSTATSSQAANSALAALLGLRLSFGYGQAVEFSSWAEVASILDVAKSTVRRLVALLASAALITVAEVGKAVRIVMAVPPEFKRERVRPANRTVRHVDENVRMSNTLPYYDHADHDQLHAAPPVAPQTLSKQAAAQQRSEPAAPATPATPTAQTAPPAAPITSSPIAALKPRATAAAARPASSELAAHIRTNYPSVLPGLVRKLTTARPELTGAEFDQVVAALKQRSGLRLAAEVAAASWLAAGAALSEFAPAPAPSAPTASAKPDYRALIAASGAPEKAVAAALKALETYHPYHWPKVWSDFQSYVSRTANA